jgi:hypothetical protein
MGKTMKIISLTVQNIEKLRIYIYMAAAAAEIFINCLRQRRRRLRTV